MTEIPGVVIRPIKRYTDDRGWLMELFRTDELPPGFTPAMGYVSMTKPGVARGPHEHADQTDGFVFLNGSYELYLWENRPGHAERSEVHAVGASNACVVFVPPGVVHAYRNVGEEEAFVLNFPDRLYAGWGRKEPVDEIRHEDADRTAFKLP